jgi:short-subunit dehydrogenase
LIARDRAALEDVKREVEKLGGSAVVAPADVADAEAVFAAAATIKDAFGAIDVWINDAMVTVFAPVWDIAPDEFRRVTEVTYLGAVHGTMAALRHMRKRNRGTLIQIGSALAYRGIPLQSAYCGAKHAIRGFTDSLRTELIHANSAIEVTIMELPAVNTPQFDWARTHMASKPRPVAPVFQPEVAADAIFRAAHQHKREYWLGLSTAEAILANMFGPVFLDRYLARTVYEGQSTGMTISSTRRDNLEHPVPSLHRTRGSFGAEASNSAVDLPGPATRLACAGAALVCAGLIGLAVGRARRG